LDIFEKNGSANYPFVLDSFSRLKFSSSLHTIL